MKPLYCKNLTKQFGGINALTGVSMELPSASIVGLVGPNGAGKTTLLNVLSGFLSPDSGSCFFGEKEITGLPPHRIASEGIVRTFQEPRLILGASVLENVMLGYQHQCGESIWGALWRIGANAQERVNVARAKALLTRFSLGAQAFEHASHLSYGQRKLLSIACCLATEAMVLLLDEPIAGVHPDIASEILQMMSELKSQGRSIVFVEHDLDAVRRVAGHVIVMDDGKIIARGEPEDVLKRRDVLEAYVGL